jgi:hypothetical protein
LRYTPSFKEFIPCPCAKCQKTADYKKRYFFSYELLLFLKKDGRTTDVCHVSYEDIPVEKLLTGIEPLNKDDFDSKTVLLEINERQKKHFGLSKEHFELGKDTNKDNFR